MNRRIIIVLVAMLLVPAASLLAQRGGFSSGILGWEDDDHYLIQERDGEGNSVVMSVDARTGKKEVSDFRDPRRELAASLPDGFTAGMGSAFSADMKSIVLSKDNDLWYFREGADGPVQLTSDDAVENNPAFSPDAMKVAFTRGRDLYVVDIKSARETRLTFDGGEKIYNGWASWVYFEEILGRGSRYSAFWWSPDSRRIAYLHTDDNPVPEFIINRIDEADGLHGTQEIVPYPKPGDPNPIVKMGVVDINSASTVWIDTDETVDQYIAWPSWTPDGSKVMVQVLNRDQNDMRFILADASTGEFREIYRETRDTWVDFFTDIYVLEDGTGFILRSYRDDWDNLYYYGWDGSLIAKLTDVDWRVNSISRVDEKKGVVWFTGTGGESTESHLFMVKLNGKGFTRITEAPGSHSVSISPGGKYLIDSWSSVTTPPAIALLKGDGKKVRDIQTPEAVSFNPETDSRSELVRIPSTDGFMLPALITYPAGFDENVKHPVVFTIYGGPDAGNVRNSWRGGRGGFFGENGIVTISVDHRGSGHFGKKGIDYMHRSLGKWEMADYIEAVRWLREKPWVDADRMGITGGSYGGYVSALALTYGADYFTHGIANYSVTDWRLYDNVYTERFMDTPQDNPEGYKNGSVLTYAGDLKGKLYIVHGMADDNVHMQNSVYLISRLQDEGKEFNMMIYPGGRHGWGGAKGTHHRDTQNRYWLKWFFDRE
jgi:dipeptidyl-peptidase-4